MNTSTAHNLRPRDRLNDPPTEARPNLHNLRPRDKLNDPPAEATSPNPPAARAPPRPTATASSNTSSHDRDHSDFQVVVKARPPPILRSIELDAWERFQMDHANYAASGGKEPKWSLIDEELAPVLLTYAKSLPGLESLEWITDAALDSVIHDMHGIDSSIDFLGAISGIRLKTSSLNDCSEYIKNWRRLLARVKVPPSETELVKLFLAGLSSRSPPTGSRELQRLTSMAGPNSIDEAGNLLLRNCSDLLRVRRLRNINLTNTNAATGATRNSRQDFRRVTFEDQRPNRTADGFTPGVCAGCAHPGHRRDNCPNKNVKGWIATPDVRRNPLRLPNTIHTLAANNERKLYDVQIHSGTKAIVLKAVFDSGAQVSAVMPAGFAKLVDMGVNPDTLAVPAEMKSLSGTITATSAICLKITGPTGTYKETAYVLPPNMPSDEADLILSHDYLLRSGLGAWMYTEMSHQPQSNAADELDELTLPASQTELARDRPEKAYENLRAEFSDVFSGIARVSKLPPVTITRRPDATTYPASKYHPRFSPIQATAASNIIKELRTANFIEPTHSPYSAPAFLVPKADGTSRMVLAEPTVSADAIGAATALLRFFSLFPLPKRIHSDRGSHFVNAVIDYLSKSFGVDHTLSSPYLHEQNSMVERRIKELLRHLRAIILERRVLDTWSRVVPNVVRILNWTPLRPSEINLSPASIVFGNFFDGRQELLLPSTSQTDTIKPGIKDSEISDFVTTRDRHLQVVHEYVRDALPPPKETDDRSIPIGSFVLYRPPVARQKLMMPNAGPFKIQAYDSTLGVYTLLDPTGGHRAAENIFAHASQISLFDSSTSNVRDLQARDTNTFLVDKILSHSGNPARGLRKMRFTVQWSGYDQTTSEPYDNVKNCVAFHDYVSSVPALHSAVARASKG